MYIICNYKSLSGAESQKFRKELGSIGSTVMLLTRKRLHQLNLPEIFSKTLLISIPTKGGYSVLHPILSQWELLSICFFDGQTLYPAYGDGGEQVRESSISKSLSILPFVKVLVSARSPLVGFMFRVQGKTKS